jgi:hypothetical protein
MVEYCCEKCGQIFVKSYNYNKHKNRKHPCNVSKIQNGNIEIPKGIFVALKNKCEYCNKQLSNSSNCLKHMKICKHRENIVLKELVDQIKIQNEKILELQEQNKKSVNFTGSSINNSNNKINNTQINNTFKVLAFGKEDMSYLTDDKIKQIMSTGDECVINMIKEKHFNNEKPEHSNICVSNIRSELMMIFDGKDWCLKISTPEILNLLKTNTDHIIGKYEELKKSLNKKTKKGMFGFLNKINYEFECHDIDDADIDEPGKISEYTRKLLKNTKLLLYNKRNMIDSKNKLLLAE